MRHEYIRLFYADNTRMNGGSGGDLNASDELATLNGGAAAGEKASRIKPGFGLDGDFTDASLINPFPVAQYDSLVTGAASQSTANNNILLASAGAGVYDANFFKSIHLQINFSAGISAGILTFEQSNDQSNWRPMPLQNQDPASGFVYTNILTAIASTQFSFAGKISARYIRVRISTGLTGGTVQAFTFFRTCDYAPQAVGAKITYRACTAAVLVPAVTVNVPWLTIYGAAGKIIRPQRIVLSGLTLTAVAYLNIGVAKYSTAPSGGTSTGLTKIPLDSLDAASGATNVNAYTVVPTTGTRIGFISVRRNLGQATTAAAAGIPENIEFDLRNVGESDSCALRGVAEGIGLEWIVAPATTVSLLAFIEWTEEPA